MFFITGIGTGIGKTLVSAIVTEALQSDYWKPIQAGFENGTDTEEVKGLISNNTSVFYPEVYKLKMPASPHIAARAEEIKIDLDKIVHQLPTNFKGVIEGAGGLMVPLNEDEFVLNLIQKLHAKVILVSRNYLGSINHSLLTAYMCKQNGIDVVGWIFNDQYLDYEEEIIQWSGYPRIASIPFTEDVNKRFVVDQAKVVRERLLTV